MKMSSHAEIEELTKKYVGKRIKAIEMPRDPHPVPPGTEGTCTMVDGAGQLVMEWDNGSTLSLIPNVDTFEVIAPTKEEIKKRIVQHLSSNVALFDCQGDCPEEVAINPELRSPEYCNNCFAEQILAIIKYERG